MSKLLGFGLIVTGMVIGGVAVPLSASSPAGRNAAVAAAPSSKGSEGGPEARTFAAPVLKSLPGAVALAPAPRAPAPLQAAPSEPHAAVRPPAAPAPRKPILTPFETVTVAEDPAAITRALQVELTRVGCYAGPATGVWGPETRRAMKAFTNRVNASLPIHKPDVILLSLLNAQSGAVCGKACPVGQEGASDGRCVPKAVLAQAARKANPGVGHGVAKAAPAKMQVAAPKPAPKPDFRSEGIAAPAPVLAAIVPGAVFADTPRMALAGPKVDEDVTAATPVAPAKPAHVKSAKKRERKDPPSTGAKYGQTRWAREFYRDNAMF